MRTKLDENLPADLAADLTVLGHDVDTVPTEGLAGQDDHHVWAAAQGVERLLITQYLDFSDIRAFAPGTHHVKTFPCARAGCAAAAHPSTAWGKVDRPQAGRVGASTESAREAVRRFLTLREPLLRA